MMTVSITPQSDPLPCSFPGVIITVLLFTCQLPDHTHTHGLRAQAFTSVTQRQALWWLTIYFSLSQRREFSDLGSDESSLLPSS